MEEWKEYKLGEVCDFQEGYVNPPQGNPEYFDGDIKWLRATDLNDRYVYSTSRTLTQLGFKSAKKSAILFKPGTIVISKSGTIGRLGILQDYMCGNRAVINIIPHHTVNTFFVFFVLRNYQRYFPSMAVGSVQKNLYISILEDLKINLPDLNTQERIVSILKSLDDKIEVNRKINENLEQQAQALFKSWFVDFEPFKNGEFVESELGMIPKGWRVGKLGDMPLTVTDYVANGSFASLKENVKLYEYINYAYFIRNTDLKSKNFSVFVDEHSYNFLSKSKLEGGEIIISNVGDVGSVHLCPYLDKPMTLGNNIIMVKPYNDFYRNFLYILFKWNYGQELIQSIKGGSAQPKFNKTDFKSLKILVPEETILKEFDRIISPLFKCADKNDKENKELSSLRDTLLPKLMSGELKVNEIA